MGVIKFKQIKIKMKNNNTDYTWYPPLAMRTCKEMPTLKDHIAHMAMGLGSEYMELNTAYDEDNHHEEVGDIAWFLAGICTSLNIPFISKPMDSWDSDEIVGDIITLCKKYFVYGVEIDIPRMTELCQCLIYILHDYGTFALRLHENLNKLKLRYPEYYTDQLAVERLDKTNT